MSRVPDQVIVQGTTSPPLRVQLLGFEGKAPDLTGKTVTCTVQSSGQCGGGGATKSTLLASDVLDAKGGYVQHRWSVIETANAGLLLVTFNDGAVTYPADDYFRVQVTPKLG